MSFSRSKLRKFSLSAIFLGFCAPPIFAAVPARLAFDFNREASWKSAAAYRSDSTLKTSAAWQKVGSYNVAGSAEQSGGWQLRADSSNSSKNWSAGEETEPVNRLGGKNSDVVFSHNLYVGGNIALTLGEGDPIADPQFVAASTDPKLADFRPKSGSPALGAGKIEAFAPFVDLHGNLRGSKPDLGAFQE